MDLNLGDDRWEFTVEVYILQTQSCCQTNGSYSEEILDFLIESRVDPWHVFEFFLVCHGSFSVEVLSSLILFL